MAPMAPPPAGKGAAYYTDIVFLGLFPQKKLKTFFNKKLQYLPLHKWIFNLEIPYHDAFTQI